MIQRRQKSMALKQKLEDQTKKTQWILDTFVIILVIALLIFSVISAIRDLRQKMTAQTACEEQGIAYHTYFTYFNEASQTQETMSICIGKNPDGTTGFLAIPARKK